MTETNEKKESINTGEKKSAPDSTFIVLAFAVIMGMAIGFFIGGDKTSENDAKAKNRGYAISGLMDDVIYRRPVADNHDWGLLLLEERKTEDGSWRLKYFNIFSGNLTLLNGKKIIEESQLPNKFISRRTKKGYTIVPINY